jgi:uncharacterized membrane protein YbhN (UPF0104 family)
MRGRALQLALLALVTVASLGVVAAGMDVDRAAAALRAFDLSVIPPMCALYAAAHALRSWRLRLLLQHPAPLRLGRLYLINAVGYLAINLLPLRLGEMVRPWLLLEQEGVDLGRSLGAVVLERLLDLLMLLGMLSGVGWWVDLPAEGLVVQGVDVVEAGQRSLGAVVALGAVCGGAVLAVGEPAARGIERLPLGAPFAALARQLRAGFADLGRRPAQAAGAVGLSVAIWALTIGAVWVVMQGFPGVPSTPGAAWTVWTITLIGMTLLPTPGFFGAYELACVSALWLWQVDGDVARGFALTLHLGQLGFTVALGGLGLSLLGLRASALIRPAPPRTGPP